MSEIIGESLKVQRLKTFWVWVIAAAPLVSLAIMTLLTFMVLGIVDCDVALPTCVAHQPHITVQANVSFAELSGRIMWGISVLFVALTAMAALCLVLGALSIIRDMRVMLSLQAVIVVALPLLYLLASDTTYSFNAVFLDATTYRLSGVKEFVSGVQAAGHATLIGLALAIGALLFRAGRNVQFEQPTDFGAVAAAMAAYHHLARMLLYFGAFVLVAGTLHSSALYHWANSIFDTGAYVPEGVSFSVVMGAMNGAFYSILLASIFVPGLTLLRLTVSRLANAANVGVTSEERARWISINSLDVSIPKGVLSALAVLAPLIIGGPGVSMLQALID